MWVKVARDQQLMGWIHEQDLLSSVVPNDPISRFIYLFSLRHLPFFVLVDTTQNIIASGSDWSRDIEPKARKLCL